MRSLYKNFMPRPYQVQDKYFTLAKQKGYRARSAFKLLEIQDKFKILKPGQVVVDMGAAPGSFLQVIAEKIGPTGKVLGFDIQEIDKFPNPNIFTFVGDINEHAETMEKIKSITKEPVDVVTSDIAPNTSGIRDLDTGRSAELCEQALMAAVQILKPGGYFIFKIFQGEDFQFLLKKVKKYFHQVNVFKPQASRDRSFETFVIAKGFKADKINFV